jgi:transcriptional regulator with XRE-family HTH domain
VQKLTWTEGDVIRKLRRAFGWTLGELGARATLDPTTLNKIELGKTKAADRATLQKLAAAFGFTLTQFLDSIPSQAIDLPLAAEALYLSKKTVDRVSPKKPTRIAKSRKGRELASS